MTKNTYDESFKRNAVSLVEADTPAAQVARDLGISAYLMCTCGVPNAERSPRHMGMPRRTRMK